MRTSEAIDEAFESLTYHLGRLKSACLDDALWAGYEDLRSAETRMGLSARAGVTRGGWTTVLRETIDCVRGIERVLEDVVPRDRWTRERIELARDGAEELRVLVQAELDECCALDRFV